MRRLTGGVSVITAGRGKDITGMTVTSVSSLSVDPPALIVSVNRAASSWPLLRRYGVFGVNILTADQLDIAERFSGKDGQRARVASPGRGGSAARPACRCWSTRSRRSIARSRKSSSAIPMPSSSAACWISSSRHAARRWPIGRASMSPSIRTRMRSGSQMSAFRRGSCGAEIHRSGQYIGPCNGLRAVLQFRRRIGNSASCPVALAGMLFSRKARSRQQRCFF